MSLAPWKINVKRGGDAYVITSKSNNIHHRASCSAYSDIPFSQTTQDMDIFVTRAVLTYFSTAENSKYKIKQ